MHPISNLRSGIILLVSRTSGAGSPTAPQPGELSIATLSEPGRNIIAEQDFRDVDVVGSPMGAQVSLKWAAAERD